MSTALAATKRGWHSCKAWLQAYLANDDPYAGVANTVAFIVWSNQPTYPLYVAWIVGRDAWPSLLTWLSTPVFFAVPLLSRRNGLAGRCLLVAAGLANSLLSLKAFGPASGIGWFLVPCLAIALTLFRAREWRAAAGLAVAAGACVAVLGRLGDPLHRFTAAQDQSLTRLNLASVIVLTLYILVGAVRIRLASASQPKQA